MLSLRELLDNTPDDTLVDVYYHDNYQDFVKVHYVGRSAYIEDVINVNGYIVEWIIPKYDYEEHQPYLLLEIATEEKKYVSNIHEDAVQNC